VTDRQATDRAAVTVSVRYFAGARAAAGVEQEQVSVPAPATVAALTQALIARHGAGLATVLAASSYLVDEVVSGPDRPLAGAAQVDVLPPFAGG
jgi:sulfur-carrier protein